MSSKNTSPCKYDKDGNFLLLTNGPSLTYNMLPEMFRDFSRVVANPADSPNYYIKLSANNPLFQVPKDKLVLNMNLESYEDYCERIKLLVENNIATQPKFQKLNCEQIFSHPLCLSNYKEGEFPWLNHVVDKSKMK